MKFLLASFALILFSGACSRTSPVSLRAPAAPVVNDPTDVNPSDLNADDSDEEEVATDEQKQITVIVQLPAATPTPTPSPAAAGPSTPIVMQTHPIYRTMHNPSGARMWTGNWSNVSNVCANYHHVYEGIAFNLATVASGPCTLPVYSCWYSPGSMFFLTYDPNCGVPNSSVTEFLGFACYPNAGVATMPLYIQRHPIGWLFYTTNGGEASVVNTMGFSTIGAFYVPY